MEIEHIVRNGCGIEVRTAYGYIGRNVAGKIHKLRCEYLVDISLKSEEKCKNDPKLLEAVKEFKKLKKAITLSIRPVCSCNQTRLYGNSSIDIKRKEDEVNCQKCLKIK